MMWVSYCTLQNGYRHRLIDRAVRQRVRLFVSEYILEELMRTLVEGLNQSPRFAMLARNAVLRLATLVQLPPVIGEHVPGDPNDDSIVQTALSAKADYVVTSDAEILRVGKVQDVQMLTAGQWEALLAPED
jgi:putative PIN family toxin of toxin-antitoxin system